MNHVPSARQMFRPITGWLLCALIGGGQVSAQRQWQESRPPHFERLSTEQGLSSHFVMTIMQDRKGFLWFGTGTGLDKYDGYRFTNYKFDFRDTTSLVKNQVFTLWEDRNGLIWVGTSEGTCRFDPRTEKFTRLEQGPGNPYAFKYAQSFSEDSEGRLWAGGSFDGALRLVDRKTGRFSKINYAKMLGWDPGGGERLHITCTDRSGALWVGSATGLHLLDLTKKDATGASVIRFRHYRNMPSNHESLSNNQISGIFEDRSGILWVLTMDGILHAFNPGTQSFKRYPLNPAGGVRLMGLLKTCIAEDPDGNLWIGTAHDGLYKVGKDRKKIVQYAHNPADPGSVASNTIISVLVDRSGILWAATVEGVIKLDPNRKPFSLYQFNPRDPHSLSDNHIAAIREDSKGIVWIGTSAGGLNALNKETGRFTHFIHDPQNPASLSSNGVTAIIESKDGGFWVANGTVLSRMDRETGRFFHYPLQHPFLNQDSSSPIFTICEDRQGLFWLGTNNGFMTFDPKNGQTKSYPYDAKHPERVSDFWSLAILEDKSGNIWIGPGSQALARFDRQSGIFKQYKHDTHKPGSISSTTVPSIFEDSKGNLWFGTGEGGLCLFDPDKETFTCFTEQQGLAGTSIFSILEDDSGNLWLGTNKGLSRFSISTHRATNFSADDGLQGNMFTTIYTEGAAFKGRDGTLYFGGINGFNAFQPSEIRINKRVPPVVISQFKLFDKLIPGKQEAKEIILNHDQNFISFEFAALNYTNSSKNQYAYMLVGLENNWVYSGTRRYANYTALSPGTYIFRVRGSNNDGIWNHTGASIIITIRPAWWQTIYFKIVLAIAFFMLVYALFLYRIRQIKNEQRIRDQISKDLHDDVGGTLSGISFYSEAAKQMHQQGRYGDSYGLVEKIAENARQTISQISDVVWFMRSESITVSLLNRRLVDFGLELLSVKNIRLDFHVDRSVGQVSLPPDQVRNLYMIGKEAIHNAAKHSCATEVQIQFLQDGRKLSMHIRDNGQGFERDNRPVGNGLENMRKRAEAIGGTFYLISDAGKGTLVCVEKQLIKR